MKIPKMILTRILTMTDIAEIRLLIDALYLQQTRIERYLALHFSVGDRVAFNSWSDTLTGIVTRVNQVTVQVSVDCFPDTKFPDDPGFRLWKVPAGKLRFVEKISKQTIISRDLKPNHPLI